MHKYTIEKQLHDSNRSTVYLVRASDGSPAALKQLKVKYFDWAEIVRISEVDVLRRVLHPNIIRLMDVIKSKYDVALTYEYFDTKLADVYLKIQDERQARAVASQLFAALQHLHERGIAHLNVAPGNIFLQGSRVVLAGFERAADRLRAEAAAPGDADASRRYRSPEMIAGLPADEKSDVWAVAVLLLEMVTGKPLFEEHVADAVQLDMLVSLCRHDRPGPELGARVGGVRFDLSIYEMLDGLASQELTLLLHQMLALAPADRPSAKAVLAHRWFQDPIKIEKPAQAPQKSAPRIEEIDEVLEEEEPGAGEESA